MPPKLMPPVLGSIAGRSPGDDDEDLGGIEELNRLIRALLDSIFFIFETKEINIKDQYDSWWAGR